MSSQTTAPPPLPAPAAVSPAASAPAATRRDDPAVPSTARPLRVAGAAAQLAALGVVGPFVFIGFFAALASGVGLVFAAGVGIIVLIALAYVLFAVAWLENARVDGLYGFDHDVGEEVSVQVQGVLRRGSGASSSYRRRW